MVEEVVSHIKRELECLNEIPGIVAVLLFGSQVNGTATSESDCDICVVAPSFPTSSERAGLLGKIWQRINADKYDVWLFEELALYFQIDVVQNHEILFCNDIPSLYEYFYWFRKLWRSQSQRQSLSFEVALVHKMG